MRPSRTILWAVLALGLFCPAEWLAAQAAERPLRVVTVGGQAEVYKAGTSTGKPARLREELEPADAVRTIAGRLTLRTGSGQAVRLGPSSRLTLLEAPAAQPTRVRLDGGTLWAAVLPGSPPAEHLEVLADAVTLSVRGSGAGITLTPDRSVRVRVYHGAVECSGPAGERRWTRVLAAEQELLIPAGAAPGNPRKLTRDKLDAAWVKWNEDQDLSGGYGGKRPER
ncbi:MAG TPA: FecR family protein [Methylomirabilota bacterium]|jgi:hypothetical protein|nr:FecR family protein [Methylomirabilota bacterium]